MSHCREGDQSKGGSEGYVSSFQHHGLKWSHPFGTECETMTVVFHLEKKEATGKTHGRSFIPAAPSAVCLN